MRYKVDFISVPVIVLCCYMAGEVYKVIFKENATKYKLIPILVAVIGGILGVIIFLTCPEEIFNADNIWTALMIGMISGFASTGTNQIIKQILKNNDIEEGEIKNE